MLRHVEKILNAAKLGRVGQKTLRKFRREEDGSMVVFSLFILILMLMISGMAVDLMRVETQRARLQATLDRAVLAGASLDQALDSEAVVRDYFEKAGLSDYLTDVQVVPGDNSKTVTASAFMEVDSYFMKMMGIESLDAPASGSAEESLSNIEISLVVDISGSMGRNSSSGQDKIDDLIDAAEDFVYLMQCNPDDTEVDEFGSPVCTVEENTVSISLVPYAEQVLVGETLLQQFDATEEQTYSSCVDFATGDYGVTTIALDDGNFLTPPTVQRTGNHDARSGSSDSTAGDSNRTCRTNSYREIVPLSNDWAALQTQIADLNAGGYTSIDIGMKWGVALLDPAFRPAVVNLSSGGSPMIDPAFADRPYDFNSVGMQKVVVLMTDGANTSQYELTDGYRGGASSIWFNEDENFLSWWDASADGYMYEDGTGPHDLPYGDEWAGDSYDISYTVRRCSGRGWRRTCWNETVTETVTPTGTAGRMTWPEVWQKYPTRYIENLIGEDITIINDSNKNGRLQVICQEAKDQGIEVFTIGFETSSTSSAVLETCSSGDNYHFDANGLTLDAAFTSIAREIHELRLTN